MEKVSYILTLGSAFCLLVFAAHARNIYTWDAGGSNANFTNTGNGDPEGVPEPGDTGSVNIALVAIVAQGSMETGAIINLNETAMLPDPFPDV